MTATLIIDCFLLLFIFVIAIILNRFLIGAGLSFLLVAIETASGTESDFEIIFRVAAILCVTVLIVIDGKKNGNNSLLTKYNPYATGSRLPGWLRLSLTLLFAIVFIARLALSMLGII